MVDILALALSHGLLLLAAWRLLWRTDLDVEERGEPQGEVPKPTSRIPIRGAPRGMRTGRPADSESGESDA
ncbi:hypothetical protein [Novosphingobium sp. P6W]|uniref:hypothetical protein n=1 Tax=Novosphingobium sp. P6W TaxID=1609758 RepID=UPI0005C30BD9|nr:hypothetical protein [Novosphingobium sp. P6W]AXB75282.1 hypothetical protein TQ38_001175 [Novosphingobium sp. P6W]KIS32665.1 hypothetical protein TQ38_10235 [Novosphingobium sp. P6W]